jgi:hypothetical protein
VPKDVLFYRDAWWYTMKEREMRKKIQGLNPVTYWTWAIASGAAFGIILFLMLMTLGAF